MIRPIRLLLALGLIGITAAIGWLAFEDIRIRVSYGQSYEKNGMRLYAFGSGGKITHALQHV